MATANVATCVPAATVTVAGTDTTPGLLLESATTAPVSHELPSASRRTALAPSLEEPPSPVEKTSADPEGLSRVRNALLSPQHEFLGLLMSL